MIQKIGNELAIAWSDGRETYLDLTRLRAACPCAVCCGEPDVTGKVIRPEKQTANGDLKGWQIVGGYGIQPQWADGHGTGIYSFAYLRQL